MIRPTHSKHEVWNKKCHTCLWKNIYQSFFERIYLSIGWKVISEYTHWSTFTIYLTNTILLKFEVENEPSSSFFLCMFLHNHWCLTGRRPFLLHPGAHSDYRTPRTSDPCYSRYTSLLPLPYKWQDFLQCLSDVHL